MWRAKEGGADAWTAYSRALEEKALTPRVDEGRA